MSVESANLFWDLKGGWAGAELMTGRAQAPSRLRPWVEIPSISIQ